MAGKREKPEGVERKLRRVELARAREVGVTIRTYYRWRKEYGGMMRDQLKPLREHETENQRLKRVVADLSLDKMIVAEAARGTEGP